MFRISSKLHSADRVEIGRIEDYAISWRTSDFTVWVAKEGSMPTNYDNAHANTHHEVLIVANEMLKKRKLIAGN